MCYYYITIFTELYKMPLTKAEYDKRWRDKNPDTYHARQKRYYNNHPEISKARVVRFRLYKSEVKRLMNILLD
jgi:hypothetical protein